MNDIAEKVELVSNTKMVTKKELLQKFIVNDVMTNNRVTVTGQNSIEYRKELDIQSKYSMDRQIKSVIIKLKMIYFTNFVEITCTIFVARKLKL